MKKINAQIAAAAVVALFFLAGCAPDPLMGVYRSREAELLKIEHDGKVFWSPPSKVRTHSDEFRFLGILSHTSAQQEPYLVMPSSHPNLRTNLNPSEDGRSIRVEWWDRGRVSSAGRSELFFKENGENKPDLATPN